MPPLFKNRPAADAFSNSLRTTHIGKQIVFHERTDSTNDLALQAARAGAPHGKVFIADLQAAGRGRRGRSWQSPPGLGLLFSVLIRLEDIHAEPADSGWIPLSAGLAVAAGIDSILPLRPALKWPNDLVIPCSEPPGWRKLGGILCESVLQPGDANPGSGFVVIGIGINVNHTAPDLPETEKAPPTSIRLETGQSAERLEVLAAILEQLEIHLSALSDPAKCSDLKQRVEDELHRWWTAERQLTVSLGGGRVPVCGRFAGLDRYGRLRLEVADQTIELADGEILAVIDGC